MFKVGKSYKITMWQDSDDGGLLTEYGPSKVLEISLPLLHLENSPIADYSNIIINTASLAFVSAKEVRE